MIYSGVEKIKRARSEVSCLIKKRLRTGIREWRSINNRIRLDIEIENEIYPIIAVHGPNEGQTKKENLYKLGETEVYKGVLMIC